MDKLYFTYSGDSYMPGTWKHSTYPSARLFLISCPKCSRLIYHYIRYKDGTQEYMADTTLVICPWTTCEFKARMILLCARTPVGKVEEDSAAAMPAKLTEPKHTGKCSLSYFYSASCYHAPLTEVEVESLIQELNYPYASGKLTYEKILSTVIKMYEENIMLKGQNANLCEDEMREEDKFIVIKREKIFNLSKDWRDRFWTILGWLDGMGKSHEYWIVNKDEPYAEEVRKLIFGESQPLSDEELEREYNDCIEIINEWNMTSQSRVLHQKSLSESQILAFLKLSSSTITRLHDSLVSARGKIEELTEYRDTVHESIQELKQSHVEFQKAFDELKKRLGLKTLGDKRP